MKEFNVDAFFSFLNGFGSGVGMLCYYLAARNTPLGVERWFLFGLSALFLVVQVGEVLLLVLPPHYDWLGGVRLGFRAVTFPVIVVPAFLYLALRCRNC